MIVYKDIEQGSTEWYKIRHAKVTGTDVKDAIKPDNLKKVDELIAQLGSDCVEEDGYCSPAMQRGKDLEPLARRIYERLNKVKVTQAGFIQHEIYDWLGLSPDGLVHNGKTWIGGTEIKCPNTETHVRYIRMDVVPVEYRSQVLSYFIIGEDIDYVDFVSYDNRYAIKPIFQKRTYRKDVAEEVKATEEALVKFWEKVQKYNMAITF